MTGPSGMGKSFMLDSFFHESFGFLTRLLEDVTEAFIRNDLRLDVASQSCPLIYVDEASSETKNKKEKIENIIQMARSAATNNVKDSGRSSPDQATHTIKKRFSIVLCSTVAKLSDMQDMSRFLKMSMNRSNIKKAKAAEFEKFQEKCRKARGSLAYLVLQNAHKYKEYQEKFYDLIHEKYKDIDIGHIDVALSFTLAGCHIFYKAYKNIQLNKL